MVLIQKWEKLLSTDISSVGSIRPVLWTHTGWALELSSHLQQQPLFKGHDLHRRFNIKKVKSEHDHGVKMVWDWQLFLAESANLPSCLPSDSGLEKPGWIHPECCPWLSCQRHSGQQANSCWTGAESRVNHSLWFVSCIHLAWCQVFFHLFCSYQSD